MAPLLRPPATPGPGVLPAHLRRRPRAILFDVGMTLIHASGRVLVEELARVGLSGEINPESAMSALALAAEASLLRMPSALSAEQRVAAAWAGLLEVDGPSARHAFATAVARPDFYSELNPEAISTLTALRERGLRLGVVSNAEGNVREELGTYGLLSFFDTVIDSALVGSEKPEPGIFHQALNELDLAGADCWHVGDRLVSDVLGALGAGLAVGVLYDPFDCFTHLPAVPRITQLEALADLIDRCAVS